jgi:SLT domain-containing protein
MITFWQQGLSGFSQFWSTIWNAILQFFSTLWNNLKAFAISIWVSLVTWWMAALNAWNLFWTNIWNTILTFFTTLWNNLKNTAIALWNTLRAFWDFQLNAFSSFWSGMWDGIKNTFDRVFSGIIDIAKRIWQTVKDVFRDSINAVIRGVNWPIDKINGLFGIAIPKIPEIGGLKAGGYVDWNQGPIPAAPIGPVRGPGGPRDDRVLTRLSNKEHVWSAKEVQAAGGHEAVARMRKAVLHQGLGQPTSRHAGAVTNPLNMGNSRLSGQERLNLMKRPNMDDAGNIMLAFGGVKPHVAEAGFAVERALGKMPGGIGGVGNRSGPSDHPSGHALDFMTLSNMALGDRVAGFLTQGWGPMSVKYLIWKQRIAERPNAWQGMENRGSVTANHFDHVHASFLGGHDGGSGFFQIDYGAIFDSLAGPFKPMGEAFLRGLIPVPPVPQWIEDMGVGMYNKGWDGIRKKAIELMQTVVGWLGGGGGGNVEQWRPAVLASLARVGQPASMADITLRRMNQESGGNPRAINNWDSNARRGTPSKGLMQVIDPTFQAHRDPGLPNDIWDPMANITASMRYTLSRYGSLPAGYNRSGGYDSGGMLQPGWTMAFNGTGEPEVVLTQSQWESLYETARNARDMITNTTNTTNNGLGPADIEALAKRIAQLRPLIGSVNQQMPSGASVRDLVDELTFELRHTQKGMYE